MKTPVSSFTGTNINTDRISVASKQRARTFDTVSGETISSKTSAFKREVPMPQNSEFVEIDGKKYFLNAPRGFYVDIIV